MLLIVGYSAVCVAWISLFGQRVHALFERDVDIGAVAVGSRMSVLSSNSEVILAQYSFPLGDINGDGIDDVIMSWSVGAFPNILEAGAYVMLGSENVPTEAVYIEDFVTSNSAGFKITAPAGYGASLEDGCISGGGDFNNDGYADILFSVAKLKNNPNQNKGIMYVIYGHNATTRSFVDMDLSTFSSGNKGFRILGATTNDQFGQAATNAGDFNSDGFDDIVACAPRQRIGTVYNVGGCYVIFGKPTSARLADVNLATFSFTATTGFKIAGAISGNYLGYSTAGGFDFNGDGRGDFAIGDEYGTYIFFGRGSAFSYAAFDINDFDSSSSLGVYIDEDSEGYGWGKGIVSPGDVNGDGIDDILLNSPHRFINAVAVIYGSRDAGSQISIQDLLTASPLGFMVLPGGDFDFGVGAAAGDMNGDGVNDLLLPQSFVSAHGREYAGYVFVVYGQNLTTDREPVYLLGGGFASGPTTGVRIFGAVEEEYLGATFGPAGDHNNDGHPDIILTNNFGQVYTMALPDFTAPPQPLYYDVDIDILEEGPTFHKVYGSPGMDACSIGDFNGDGIDDLFIAAMLYNITTENDLVGGAYVLFGNTTTPGAPLDMLSLSLGDSSSAGFRIIASSLAYVGPVTVGGDYNNDGFADVLVVDPSFGGTGAVFVIYGHNASQIAFEDLYLSTFVTGPRGFRILGATGDQLGGNGNPYKTSRSVSSAGDFNSDGFDDIMACAPLAANEENAEAGVCYVIFGKPTSARTTDINLSTFVFTATTGFKIQSKIASAYFGLAVRGGFDFNHDGHDDLLIGDPTSANIGGVGGGGAYILCGRGSAYSYASFNIEDFVSDGVYTSKIVAGGSGWGSNVDALGDVNGDGIDDILIQPPLLPYAAVIFGSDSMATSYDVTDLVDTPNSSVGWLILSTSDVGAGMGMFVSPAGDANGDGINDILVSLQYESPLDRPEAGIVYVIYGKVSAGTVYMDVAVDFFSGPTTGVRILGSVRTSNLATALRAGGDFNHDGRADLLLISNIDFDIGDSPVYFRLGASQMYILNVDQVPSVSPTRAPTATPSTALPSFAPVPAPTAAPTRAPTATPSTALPSFAPVPAPTAAPMDAPSIWHDVDLDGNYHSQVTSGYAMLGAMPDLLGASVSAVGDFNGDGIDDLLVGARTMQYQSAQLPTGGAYLILGTAGSAPGTPDLDLVTFGSSTTAGLRIIGPESFSQAGTSVGSGDFNKDGFTDILVSATSFDSSRGVVYVIYGHNASTRAFVDLYLDAFATGDAGFIIYGAAGGDSLGGAASNAGDVNSDTFDDIIVCAAQADPAGSYNGGICYVIFGKPTSARTIDIELSSFSFTATTGFKILGSGMIASLGISAAGGFDFNDDGHSDVIVGAYGYAPSGRSMAGAAFVIFGHPTEYAFATIDTSGFTSSTSVGLMIMGAAENNYWASGVASAGDVNNDGFDDVIVRADSSPIATVVFGSASAGTSNVDLLGFTAGTLGFQLSDSSGYFLNIAGAGDVNGDGIDDLLIGNPAKDYLTRVEAGQVYVIFGKESTAPVVNVNLGTFTSGARGILIIGSSLTNNLGGGVSAVGDLNRDGVRDFTVTSTLEASYGRTDAGKLYILTVAPPVPTFAPTAPPTTRPTSVRPSLTPTVSPTAPPSLAPTMDPAILASVLSSPTYKVRNGFAFAVRSAAGKVLAWGEAPHGGTLGTPLDSGVAEVVPGRFAFAARKSDGDMLLWGVVEGAGAAAVRASSLVANEASFAAVTVDGGAVVAFGSNVNGGNVVDEVRCNGYKIPLSSGVSKITASSGAFAALKEDGTVYAWGNHHVGGGTSTLNLPALAGVSDVVATRSAFAALLMTGAVVVWGDKYSGGDASAVSSHLTADVVHVIASRAAFVAFTKTNGLVVWGHPKYGGDVGTAAGQLTSNVKFVAQTFTAMAAVKFDGSVVTWGKPDCGGDSLAVQADLHHIVKVVGNGRAFVALNSTGGVVAWGKPSDGGVIPADKAAYLGSGVVSIHHTDRAFAALRSDGRVVVWGQAGHGGSPGGAVEQELASGVHTVCANDAAFSAIKFNGDVVGWGHAVSIPTPGVLFNSGILTSATCA